MLFTIILLSAATVTSLACIAVQSQTIKIVSERIDIANKRIDAISEEVERNWKIIDNLSKAI